MALKRETVRESLLRYDGAPSFTEFLLDLDEEAAKAFSLLCERWMRTVICVNEVECADVFVKLAYFVEVVLDSAAYAPRDEVQSLIRAELNILECSLDDYRAFNSIWSTYAG